MTAKISANISWFEYFLYTAIILETALAAFVYKIIFSSPGPTGLTVSLTIIYFGFLAWAILQLNLLHRRRKTPRPIQMAETVTEVQTVAKSETVAEAEPAAPARILGLSAAQVVVVFVVFAAALVSFTWALSGLNPHR